MDNFIVVWFLLFILNWFKLKSEYGIRYFIIVSLFCFSKFAHIFQLLQDRICLDIDVKKSSLNGNFITNLIIQRTVKFTLLLDS